jgi:DNA repair protein RadC
MQITALPKSQRPREKLIEFGAENLKDHELLAILLRTGLVNKNALELGQDVLKRFKLEQLSGLNLESLTGIKGIDKGKACSILAAIELTKRSLHKIQPRGPIIASPEDVLAQLKDFPKYQKEHFAALYLNARNELVSLEVISVGILNASLVHAREVFEPALRCLAAYVILAHNHPSGDLEPSQEDIRLTKQLIEAGKIMGIEVLDHLIISREGKRSMKLAGVDFS